MRFRILTLSLFLVALAGSARAQSPSDIGAEAGVAGATGAAAGIFELVRAGTKAGIVPAAPEISGADASGLVLLIGGIAVLRGRRRNAFAQSDAKA